MSFAVPKFNKRTVLLLSAIALGGGLMVVCLGKSAPDQAGLERSAPDPNLPAARANEGASPESGEDRDSPDEFTYDPGDGIGYDLVRAVLLVAVLGAAAIYVSKKLLPKITNLPGKEVRVVETVYLGPRKAVHVLEVGSRRFLVGSTNENITKLADITDDLTDLSAQEVGYN